MARMPTLHCRGCNGMQASMVTAPDEMAQVGIGWWPPVDMSMEIKGSCQGSEDLPMFKHYSIGESLHLGKPSSSTPICTREETCYILRCRTVKEEQLLVDFQTVHGFFFFSVVTSFTCLLISYFWHSLPPLSVCVCVYQSFSEASIFRVTQIIIDFSVLGN